MEKARYLHTHSRTHARNMHMHMHVMRSGAAQRPIQPCICGVCQLAVLAIEGKEARSRADALAQRRMLAVPWHRSRTADA